MGTPWRALRGIKCVGTNRMHVVGGVSAAVLNWLLCVNPAPVKYKLIDLSHFSELLVTEPCGPLSEGHLCRE